MFDFLTIYFTSTLAMVFTGGAVSILYIHQQNVQIYCAPICTFLSTAQNMTLHF